MSVSVYGLGGSIGFDLLGGCTGSNPLSRYLFFLYNLMTPCFLFGAWTGDTSIICNVLMLRCIAMRPQLYGTVINFLHGCSEK